MNSTSRITSANSRHDAPHGFVVDGYRRALDGMEATIRPEIEKKYAEELRTAGLVKRWWIARRIEEEVRELVAEKAKSISRYSLF